MPWRPKYLTRKPSTAIDLRPTASERGYDADWQRLRLAVLDREPFCRICEADGRTEAAVLVDHIVPIEDGGERLDESNLQPLCRLCHGNKTAADLSRRRGSSGDGSAGERNQG
jgi:5-methylcytosine-specific restriction enzyme A